MRVFLCTGTHLVYADPFFHSDRHTPSIHRSPNTEFHMFLPVFQLWKIKEANQQAILNALRHPDANITKLLEETKAKYKSKSPATYSLTFPKNTLECCFLQMVVLLCSYRQRCPRL